MLYRSIQKGFTLIELMVVIAILAMLVSILAIAVIPPLINSRASMDQFNMAKLAQSLQAQAMANDSRQKLSSGAFKEATGRAFWEQCFKQKLLDSESLKTVVSLGSVSGDTVAKPEVIDGVGEFTQLNCSYTSPRGDKLIETMMLSGRKRVLLFSFDSRNWNNYESTKGVLVSWSEGDQAAYIDQATAEAEYGISKQEWASPGESIIGRKGPWARTFEEGRK